MPTLLQASLEAIEAEFWKVVEEAEDPVEVLYGADIDTTITGSGFPQKVWPCLVGFPAEGLEYGPMLHIAPDADARGPSCKLQDSIAYAI